MHQFRAQQARQSADDRSPGDALLAAALVERAVESLIESVPSAGELEGLGPVELLDAYCARLLADPEPLRPWAMLTHDALRPSQPVRELMVEARSALFEHASGIVAALQAQGQLPEVLDVADELGHLLMGLNSLASASLSGEPGELLDAYLVLRADVAERFAPARPSLA